jgi:hypothetical protein
MSSIFQVGIEGAQEADVIAIKAAFAAPATATATATMLEFLIRLSERRSCGCQLCSDDPRASPRCAAPIELPGPAGSADMRHHVW